jgi:hypothetical protein
MEELRILHRAEDLYSPLSTLFKALFLHKTLKHGGKLYSNMEFIIKKQSEEGNE